MDPLLLISFFALFSAAILLIILTVIDLKHWLLPNIYVFPFGALALAFHACFSFSLIDSSQIFLGFIVGGGLLLAIRTIANGYYKTDTLGLGDVKLMAAAGLWLGVEHVLIALIIGAGAGVIHGGIYWVYLNFIKHKKTSFHRLKLPAGPGLIIGIVVCGVIPGGILQIAYGL